MTVPVSDAVLQPLMRIPADMSSVRGSKRTYRGMSRATALCTALDNIVLLVANAKRIADNYTKVTIVDTQIRARLHEFGALL